MPHTVPSGVPAVTAAIAAIRAFGGEYLTRIEANELLDLWRHRADFSQTEVNEVLAHFPVDRRSPAPMGGLAGRHR